MLLLLLLVLLPGHGHLRLLLKVAGLPVGGAVSGDGRVSRGDDGLPLPLVLVLVLVLVFMLGAALGPSAERAAANGPGAGLTAEADCGGSGLAAGLVGGALVLVGQVFAQHDHAVLQVADGALRGDAGVGAAMATLAVQLLPKTPHGD